MTLCSANFETGTHASNVLNTDTASGTAFSSNTNNSSNIAGSATLKYDNTHPAFGTLACLADSTPVSQNGISWFEWGSSQLGTVTDFYGRMYMYLASNPVTVNWPFMQLISTATLTGGLGLTPAGKLFTYRLSGNQAAITTTSVALGQLIRVEFHFIMGNASNGTLEAKLFNTASATTPTETLTTTSQTLGATSANIVRVGTNAAGGLAANNMKCWYDNVIIGHNAWPGPYPTNTVAPAVSGSTPVGSVLTSGTGTWNITPSSYTYQWTRGGSNIGGATSSTYTTQTADIGAAVGCTVTAIGVVSTETAAQTSSNTVAVTAAVAGATLGRDRFRGKTRLLPA